MASSKQLSDYSLFYEEIPSLEVGDLEDTQITDLTHEDEPATTGLSDEQCAQLAVDTLQDSPPQQPDSAQVPLPAQLFDH